MSSDHAPQPGLVHTGPVVGLWEFDVQLGAAIPRLRRSLGRAVAAGAVLGLSSSLLGTLDPVAMPGGFRPFDRHQPDLVLWVNGVDERACATAGTSAEEELAAEAAPRHVLVGPLRPAPVVGPVPAIRLGPGAGGTYVVLLGPVEPAVPHLVVAAAQGPTHVVLAGDLHVLDRQDPDAVGRGGLYLAPDLDTVDRLTNP